MADYRYLAADLLTGAIREEVPLQGVSYGDVLNAQGACNSTVPLSLKRTRTSSKSYTTTVRSDAPAMYLRLSETAGTNADDASGSGNVGTYRNAPLLATPGLLVGDTNRGVTLDAGSSQDVRIPSVAEFKPKGLGAITVEILATAATFPLTGVLISKATEWEIGQVAGIYYAKLFQNDGTSTFCIATAPVTTTAHYVCMTWDGTTLGLYIGGVLVASSSSTTGTLNTSGTAVTIGSRNGAAYWSGIVDEVAIYPTCLSATRVFVHAGAAAGTLETSTVSFDAISRATLDPGRTAIYVERDGAIQWGGILWTAQADDTGYSVKLGAEGFWSYYDHRFVRADKAYAAQDQLAVFRALISYANSIGGGDIGVAVGSETCGVLVSATFAATDRANIRQACEDLAAADGGFDFAITTAYVAGVPTKTLQLFYPRKGLRTSHILDLGTNVEGFAWNIDATLQANVVDALGAGTLIGTAADTAALASYPLLEGMVQYKNETVQASLDARARSAVAGTRLPVETFPSLSVHLNADLQVGDVQTGDEIEVRAQAAGGFLGTIDGMMRVLSWEVKPDENGKESLTLDLAPTEAVS